MPGKRKEIDRAGYFDAEPVQSEALPDELVKALVPADMDAIGYSGQSLPVVHRPDGTVQVGNFLLSATGLTSTVEVDREEWLAFYEGVKIIKRRMQWIVGDWMVYGAERSYVNSYEEIAALTGLKVGTVKVYTSVCRSIPPLIRINRLEFAHFQLIAPLSDEDKAAWIQRATLEKMSVSTLKFAISGEKVPPPPLSKKETNLLSRFVRAIKKDQLATITDSDMVLMRKAFDRAEQLRKNAMR